MKWVKRAILITLTVGLITGGIFGGAKVARDYAKLSAYEGSVDKVDNDFETVISPTKEKYLYSVEIRKVNPKAKKVISGWPVMVDFRLKRPSGLTLSGPINVSVLAEEKTSTLENFSPTQSNSRKGLVQLITNEVAPGVYELEATARIIEHGLDAIRGPYNDCGSVAVEPGNSLKVTISK